MQRRRWQRRESSNDGLAHVLVPHDAIQSTPPVRRPRHADDASPSPHPTTPPDTNLLAGALAALEDAVAGLRGQLDVANARAERAEAAVAGLESDVRDLRAHATALQVELADRQAALERTQGEAAALRERVDELQAG